MKAYKGFKKGLVCREKQYTDGEMHEEDNEVQLCDRGMHACLHPLDVFSYYPPGANTEYRVVEIPDDAVVVGPRTGEDSKIAVSKLRIIPNTDLKSLITAVATMTPDIQATTSPDAHTATTSPRAHAATTGDGAHAATTGDGAHVTTAGDWARAATTGPRAHAATTGLGAHAATTGLGAHAATTGDWAHAATTGPRSYAATTGNRAHAAAVGNCAHAATTGNRAHAATTGDDAHATTAGNCAHAATTGNGAHATTAGNESISCSLGRGAIVSAGLGGHLVAAWYDYSGVLRGVKTAKITARSKLRPGRKYRVNPDGKWEEVE